MSFTILIVSRRSPTKCAARTKLLFMVPDELCENLDIRSCRSKIVNVKIKMGVVFCAWAKSKTIDKSLNSAWFICVNWARILNGSVFCRPVNFFIRLKIRPTPCERSLKLFCVFLRWHLTIPLCDCWIQKTYSRTLLTNDHLPKTVTLFCPGGQSIHWPLFKPLYNGNGHKRVSPTAKITSRQRPVFSATDEKVKNGYDIWYVWRTNPQI